MSNTSRPRTHTFGLGIIREERGLLLLLRRRGEELWRLPGGSERAELGETADEACQRVIHEETGIRVTPHTALVIDRVLASGKDPEERYTVFNCGAIEYQKPSILLGPELSGYVWIQPDRTADYLDVFYGRRAQLGLDALEEGSGIPILDGGNQARDRPEPPAFSPFSRSIRSW
ncbi:NUDIX domain-containing protein [Streptomyces alboflavus]|uniref:NUDIX domain-containing protein n=1 Tax=Streptomyces alboflavus TaxID=67267 RepID=UPI000F658A61|nr:NUDIX hydrolase [Streptomyces alboflavus]